MTTFPTTTFPTDRHGFIHRSAAISAGLSDRDLDAAVRSGYISRLVRGVFVEADARTPAQWHRLRAIAVAVGGTGSHPLSHQSAAALHGLPLLKPNYRRVHSTIRGTSGGRRTATRHEHVGTLSDADLTTIDGIAVTTLERTAVDVACTSPMGFAGALAVFDAALRKGADADLMSAMLKKARRGVGPARRALASADPLSENPGESWGRAQILEAGLPAPRLQHEFTDADGTVFARTDYDWEGRVVGEFDGKVKYGRSLKDGDEAGNAVWREKRREDKLRRMRIGVVRWTWADLESRAVAALVRAELFLAGLLAV